MVAGKGEFKAVKQSWKCVCGTLNIAKDDVCIFCDKNKQSKDRAVELVQSDNNKCNPATDNAKQDSPALSDEQCDRIIDCLRRFYTVANDDSIFIYRSDVKEAREAIRECLK